MPFQVSPGVNVTEIDLTTIVPAVSSTEGAIAGVFKWGPAETRDLISSETELVARYGRPTTDNFETFFTAANFLAYGNKLYVSRAVAANSYNAYAAEEGDTVANTQIKNDDDYLSKDGSLSANALYFAKYAGVKGNSLKISVCDSVNAYSTSLTGNSTNITAFTLPVNGFTMTMTVTNGAGNTTIANTVATNILNLVQDGDYIRVGNTSVGTQYLRVNFVGTPSTSNGVVVASIGFDDVLKLSANVTTNTVTRFWEYFNFVDAAPGTSQYTTDQGGSGDEIHVVIADVDGGFTSIPPGSASGQVLEVWPNLSRATDAKGEQGGSIYYKDVLNNSSKYVWWANDRTNADSDLAADITAATTTTPLTVTFAGGTDGVTESTITLANMAKAYDVFSSPEDIDVSLILTGKSRFGVAGEGLANYLIDNLAETRKDCVVFCSPDRADVVQNPGDEANAVVAFRNQLRSTSYAVLDSGYKYQYDKYNDKYRWVPLNGDVAGTVVRTDDVRDPWFSPAGFNRGQIKNIVRLAYNPDKADRDVLYKAGINPVVNFPGQGTVLFGDKTLLAKPSAFDRINVRRLFIVLEKAISTASKFTLFEFNDEFTRATFRNLVEPYLRDIQGRRGIFDFRVVCDETNNTPEVVDRNEFVGDIYIKPARSINYIQLNFVAVRTGVEFDEIVGRV